MNRADREGMTPLHMAVKFPKLDIPMVRLLLEHGCDSLNLHSFTRWLIAHRVVHEDFIANDADFSRWLRLQETSVLSLKQICRLTLQRELGFEPQREFTLEIHRELGLEVHRERAPDHRDHRDLGHADSLRAKARCLPLPERLQSYVSIKPL